MYYFNSKMGVVVAVVYFKSYNLKYGCLYNDNEDNIFIIIRIGLRSFVNWVSSLPIIEPLLYFSNHKLCVGVGTVKT